MPHVDTDYEAEADLDALQRADEVKSNPLRLSRLRGYLEDKKEAVDKALSGFASPGPAGFNNAARSKRSL